MRKKLARYIGTIVALFGLSWMGLNLMNKMKHNSLNSIQTYLLWNKDPTVTKNQEQPTDNANANTDANTNANANNANTNNTNAKQNRINDAAITDNNAKADAAGEAAEAADGAESARRAMHQQKKKKIFVYTELFGNRPWPGVPEDHDFTAPVHGTTCEYSHCQLTYDTNKLEGSDIVFAHGRDLRQSAQQIKQDKLKVNNDNAIWIYFIHESPMNVGALVQYDGLFDWSASYRTASEIQVPYFGFKDKLTKDEAALKVNYANGKDKGVLYINGNCDKVRMDFVKSMKKQQIKIDVYGGCSKKINPGIGNCPRKSPECEALQRRYKFYLAFENSQCIDYVTEKYYENSLIRGLVPIVVGHANYSDPRIGFHGSYIDAKKFKDMKELADYLTYLDKNDEEYNKFHHWRAHKYFPQGGSVFCELCEKAWKLNEQIKKNGKVDKKPFDISKFWGRATCLDARKEVQHLL